MVDLQAIDAYLTRIRAAKTADLKPCTLITPAFIQTPPHAVGVAHLILRPRMVLGDPTGTGKTPTCLVAYGYLKEKMPGLKMLVLAGMAAQFQWARAAHRFLRGVKAEVLSYSYDPDADRFTQLGVAGRAQQWPALMAADIWVTTMALAVKEEANLLKGLDQFVYVIDEVHGLNNHKGEVMYPSAARVTQKARCAWGLSATPMENGKIDEIYSVFELVRPGTFNGDWNKYRKTFYDMELVRPKWRIKGTTQRAKPFYKPRGLQNLDLLRSQIDPFYLARPVHEFQQYLPPVRFKQYDIPLDPKQRSLYKDLIGKHWPVSRTPIQQLASLTYAQLAVDAPTLVGFPSVPCAKSQFLLGLLANELVGQKVIVYSKFEKVVMYLSALLTKARIAHGVIAGPVSATKRDDVKTRFQEDPSLRVVLITDAGSESLDLQAASVVAFYDIPWSWGPFTQVIGRARRTGSKHESVLALLLCAASSIDIAIATRVQQKEDLTRVILPQGFSVNEARLKQRQHVSADASTWIRASDVAQVSPQDVIALPPDDVSDLFKAVRAAA